MDLTWVWAAVAAVAAAASAVWSVMQAAQSRSPFSRYEQWTVIAKDHFHEPEVHGYAEQRVRECIVILASRSEVTRTRRKQWVAATVVFVITVVLAVVGNRSGVASVLLGFVVAAILIVGDLRVSWLHRQTYRRFYPEPTNMELSQARVTA